MSQRRRPLTALAAALWIILPIASLPAQSLNDSQVDSTIRNELSRTSRYPWFDNASGRAQPVELNLTPEPRAPARWDRWTWWNNRPRTTMGSGWSRWIVAIARFVPWILLGLLAVYLVLMARRTVLKRFGIPRSSPGLASDEPSDEARIENLPVTLASNRRDLLQQAAELYQRHEFELATVYLFSYQLVALDKSQLLRLEKEKPIDNICELEKRVEVQRIFNETMLAFEDVFFGKLPVGRQRLEHIWQQLDRFHQLIRPTLGVN